MPQPDAKYYYFELRLVINYQRVRKIPLSAKAIPSDFTSHSNIDKSLPNAKKSHSHYLGLQLQ